MHGRSAQSEGRERGLRREVVDLNAVVAERVRQLQGAEGPALSVQVHLDATVAAVGIESHALRSVVREVTAPARWMSGWPRCLEVSTETATGAEAGFVRLRVCRRDAPPSLAPAAAGAWSAAHTVVVRFGGSLEVCHNPPDDTEIVVLLAPARLQGPAARRPAPDGEAATVLVVSDDAAVRRCVCSLLEDQQLRVFDAPTALQALARHGDAEFDLLVTEALLPGGLSGPDLANRLEHHLPHLGVVFLSALHADRLRATDRRRWSVREPFTPVELSAAVAEALMAGTAR